MVLFIARRVGKNVPDEVVPSKKYLELARDALMIITLALALYPINLWLSIIFAVLLIVARIFINLSKGYTSITGITVGLCFAHQSEIFTIITLILVANFLFGLTEKKLESLAAHGLIQPIGALIVYVLI